MVPAKVVQPKKAKVLASKLGMKKVRKNNKASIKSNLEQILEDDAEQD